MNIIVRACGERTEKKCIELARKQGTVYVIHAAPFGESIRQTYKLALTWDQKWTAVIDADVQLYQGVLKRAIEELNTRSETIFCLDGKTDDKIFMHSRRAGIHIYRTKYLKQAMQFIDNSHIKPESCVRRHMEKLGYKTYVSRIIFGKHDHDQYYADLWRKAICQTKKLEKKIGSRCLKWARLAKIDNDFRVIYHANLHGKKLNQKIIIDHRIDYDAKINLKKLGIIEKGPMK